MLITVTQLNGTTFELDSEEITEVSWHPGYTVIHLKNYFGSLQVVDKFDSLITELSKSKKGS